MSWNPLYEAAKILSSDNVLTESTRGYALKNTMAVLEDVNSPVTRKYHEKLFQSVIDKNHVDFGDIPKSAGNIRQYKGYESMMSILDILSKLANSENGGADALKYVKIVSKAIENISDLAPAYSKGFMTHNDYVMLEYNTYVYTCVEATTTLAYEFVDYVKRPDQVTMNIVLKNNTSRANLFYFEQLIKFNNVNEKMGIEYRKMLESMSNSKSNFFGVDEVVGIAAISMAAMAIVPITRELIYQIYKIRGNLSKSLEMQAAFLEMNKACVEANGALTIDKKKKILDNQLKIKNRILKIADFLKVKTAKATVDSKRELAASNKLLSIDNLRDEVSNSPLELI